MKVQCKAGRLPYEIALIPTLVVSRSRLRWDWALELHWLSFAVGVGFLSKEVRDE